ncbi:MAG: alkaline phosphatase family protein [Deltaproteobacteria bacterium]|nr:alkaline phosphatase family protein [Deltaproteobacteria bacterium]
MSRPGGRGHGRALVVGFDGADWDVLRPLVAAGRMPHLAGWLREAGAAGGAAPPGARLPSTTPPMSFPAWSSFATGLAPGHHGVFDFTQKLDGAWRLRFVNATDRRGASLWGRLAAAGGAFLCLGVPATFPAEPLPDRHGLLVPGFDAPVSTGSDARAASDPARYARIARRAGPWMVPDLDERARTAWRSRAAGAWYARASEVLLGRIDRKTGFALEALRQLREEGREPDLMVVVFSESDTAAHHFWRDHDPGSPRHDPAATLARRGALAAVYERLDAAAGALRAAFGDDATCVLLSDHGQGGASRRVLHLNRRLADCGLLARAPRSAAGRGARLARDTALRWLPPRAAQAVFRRARTSAARLESAARFGGVDWRRTVAVSEEANTQPGVWIALRGREAGGAVAPADYERVRQDVIDALLDWKLEGGAPVIARARRREEVYEGPFVPRAPDVVVELALEDGYAHSLVPTPWHEGGGPAVRTLTGGELGGGRGCGLNGTHRPDGIWLALGAARPAAPASIAGVAPALAPLLGLAAAGSDHAAPAPAPYDAAQEGLVAARLRALGYLE